VPPIFDRAAITLGIGPHSSFCYSCINFLTSNIFITASVVAHLFTVVVEVIGLVVAVVDDRDTDAAVDALDVPCLPFVSQSSLVSQELMRSDNKRRRNALV